MEVKYTDLPGVGRKYKVNLADGRLLVIVIHHTGRREMYFLADADDDEPLFTLDLNDEEARKVGAILLGADYQPVSDDRVETLLKSIRIEWIPVSPGSGLANEKLKDAQIRTLTGVTVIAIQRGEEMIGSPDINEILRPGDVLMVIGKREQIKSLQQLAKG